MILDIHGKPINAGRVGVPVKLPQYDHQTRALIVRKTWAEADEVLSVDVSPGIYVMQTAAYLAPLVLCCVAGDTESVATLTNYHMAAGNKHLYPKPRVVRIHECWARLSVACFGGYDPAFFGTTEIWKVNLEGQR